MKNVTRSTIWRLIKMWAKTHEDWRCLEWNIFGECVARFRHYREIELQGVMTWEQYHQYRKEGNKDEQTKI
jgi:hypothetical protein